MKNLNQIIAIELCLNRIQKIGASYQQRARKKTLSRTDCEEMQVAINSALEEVFITCVAKESPLPHTVTGQGTSQRNYYY